MLRRRVLPKSACLALAAATFGAALWPTVGCASWDLRNNTYKTRKYGYSFGSPGDDWRPVRENIGKEVQVAWVQPELVGIIEIHAQCDEQGDSSLHQYTDHLRIDWTDWQIVEQEETRLVGRSALRTVVDAQLDGMERRTEVYVVKKNGCLFDLIYSSRPGDFNAGRNDFRRVVEGFQFPLGR